MDYHLDKKIQLNNKTEHKDLYSWCLQEIKNEKEQQGVRDLIPWKYDFYFTASELRLSQGLEFGKRSILEKEQRDEPTFQDSEVITATLHPGTCTDGELLEDAPEFSMFGTDRNITKFSLSISAVEEGKKEYCKVWGCVGYTMEVDFRDDTTPDAIVIYLGLSRERFTKFSKLISNKLIDVARVRIDRVSGFYSDWSPSISTDCVKVLACESEQKIDIPKDCEIEPPKLGNVGAFDLTLITRNKLNPKQNLNSLNISKLFGYNGKIHEEKIEESEDTNKRLLTQIAQNQVDQNKLVQLKIPIWITVVLLVILLLTV